MLDFFGAAVAEHWAVAADVDGKDHAATFFSNKFCSAFRRVHYSSAQIVDQTSNIVFGI